MNLLIIGNGQLGSAITKIFSKNKEYNIKTTGIENEYDLFFDLTKDDLEKKLENYKPEIIILTAAYTHVDGCEQNPNLSKLVNVIGVQKVTNYCKKHETKLIFFSTDYIFDGEKGPYNENDAPNPLNIYGAHKLEAENIIKENLKNYLIIRTAWLADPMFDDKNYIAQVLRKLKNAEIVKAVTDQYGNPTLTRNLVHNMEVLIKKNANGIFHVCGAETIDRFTYTKKLAKGFGYDENLVLPAISSDFPSTAIRPVHGGLNVSKVQKIEGIKLLKTEEIIEIIKNPI